MYMYMLSLKTQTPIYFFRPQRAAAIFPPYIVPGAAFTLPVRDRPFDILGGGGGGGWVFSPDTGFFFL